MATITAKKNIVIPAEGEFGPAPISGKVSGKGFPDFDGEPDQEYSVAVKLGKAERKWLEDTVMDFWEANKPKEAGDVPSNFDGLLRRDDHKVFVKTKAWFDDERNEIPVVNGKGARLDPKEFGNFQEPTKGRVSATMGIYQQGRKYGVSLFLNAVKIVSDFTPYAGGGADAFGEEEGDVEAAGGFGREEAPKKEKKKKKKKKKEAE